MLKNSIARKKRWNFVKYNVNTNEKIQTKTNKEIKKFKVHLCARINKSKCNKMRRVKLKVHKNFKPLFSVLLLLSSLSLCLGAQEKLLRINTALTALPTATVSSSGAFNSPIEAQGEHEALPLDADSHICVREETYVEQLKVPTMQPVRIRSSQWCMEIPPRCSNYKTEMREVVQIKVSLKRKRKGLGSRVANKALKNNWINI